jgi:hypothetical protein
LTRANSRHVSRTVHDPQIALASLASSSDMG